jgi:hypothetical protein
MSAKYKICRKCTRLLPVADFYRCSPERHHSYCKLCHYARVAELRGMKRAAKVKRTKAERICSKCDCPGFRWRGERWLCIFHHRFDTMITASRTCGKTVPTERQLWAMAVPIITNGMKCPSCDVVMQWTGNRQSHTISLQHDRSGALRLICMLCNQRHDDLPGDTFFELPKDHWRCPRCEQVLPLTAFYKDRAGGCCKVCRKKLNREMWAKFGKQWQANSEARAG